MRSLWNSLTLQARMLGFGFESPTYLPRNDFSPVAEWMARRRAEGVSVLWMGRIVWA